MTNRDTDIFAIRGAALGSVSPQSSTDEAFQNLTLRPILKLQNELFIQIFINYAVKQKNVFFTLSPDKKVKYIDNALHRDMKFRNLLKGVIIGFFTINEFQDYIKISSNLNKRMMNLLIERLTSQVQLIEI